MSKTSRLLAAVLAAAMGFTLAASSASAETLIKVATFVPAKSVGVDKVIKPWMDAVQADIGNKAKLQGFWGGILGKAPFKQFELVKNGVADVTWVLPGYTAGQFPQMGVFELPFLFRDGVEASIVGWKLHERGLLGGLEDVHLVGFFASEPNALFMRNPIQDLGDISNKKIRSAGAIHAKWLDMMKASPQTLSSAQMNEALNRGTIDGVVQGWTGMRTFKTMPLVQQAYTVPVGVIPFLLVMNKKTWDSLPKDVQASIMKHGGLKMAQTGGKAYTEVGEAIRDKAKKDGKPSLLVPTKAQIEDYQKQAQPIYDWWIKKTPNGQAVYDAAIEELKKLRG
jgi:TRAP-type C4-dicarboxylate transport system substrate-binding protein